MKNLIKGLLFTFLLALVAGNSIAQKSNSKKVLVTIGDEKVTTSEFVKIYEKNNTETDMYDSVAVKDYLDLYINFKLKVLEAEALEMDTVSAFIKELDGYRTQLAKPYFIDESVNEQLLNEAYAHLIKDIRASHILIMADENASPADTLKAFNRIYEIREEVILGKDFSEAAVEYSDDPSARDTEAIPNKSRFRKGNKGDLGYFTVFNMVYPFENAAYNTAVNEISPVVRTKYGYHILKVTDINDAMGNAEVAHIFVALRPEATSADSARKVEKINNIYAKINEGMTFEDAVVEYSEDKGSVKNQGKLSKFSCNRVVPEFVEVVDLLEIDEIAEPIKTSYGFHIIKLVSIDQPGTFDEESPKLKERLTKDQRSRKSKDAVIAKIKLENKFKIYPKDITAVFSAIDSTVLQKKFVADSIIVDMKKPVLKLKKEKYSQYDFAKFVETNQSIQENISKDVYLTQLFAQFENECCLDFMDKNLENLYPEFKDLVKEYHDGILLFNLTDEKVWTKAVKDTIGLQEFFNKNQENYFWNDRVNATVFILKDKSVTDQVVAIINEYDNDGDIAKAFAADSITSVRIIPGLYEKGDDRYVDSIEWNIGLSEPINSDVEDITVFVKITDLVFSKAKEIDEARGIVTADYQTYLENEWIEYLKNKYPVSLNNDVLNSIIISK